ncbi:hypothetical protein ACETU7_35465 [Rhodococcus sp. 3Y1]
MAKSDDDWPAAPEAGTTRYSIFHGDHLIGFIQWYEAEDNPDFRHAGLDLFLDPDFHGRGSVANRFACCVPT